MSLFNTAAETLKTMLAACQTFAAECDGTAADSIFTGAAPGDDEDSVMPAVRALVSDTGGDSVSFTGTGSAGYSGTLELRLAKQIPEALRADDSAALAEFGDWANDMVDELLEQSLLAGGLYLRPLRVTSGPLRYDDEAHKNTCEVFIEVPWGLSD